MRIDELRARMSPVFLRWRCVWRGGDGDDGDGGDSAEASVVVCSVLRGARRGCCCGVEGPPANVPAP